MYWSIRGGEIINFFFVFIPGQVDFKYFLGADSENRIHFCWKLIFSLLPYAPSWPEHVKISYFSKGLNWSFYQIYLVKYHLILWNRLSYSHILGKKAQNLLWGLVMLWTKLAKTLKIVKIAICYLLTVISTSDQVAVSKATK